MSPRAPRTGHAPAAAPSFLSLARRSFWLLFAGVWLTACTYPVVWLVLPGLFEERWVYLLVAETFAPAAECALFWFAFVRGLPPDPPVDEDNEWWFIRRVPADRRATLRDLAAIVVANLCSFGMGEAIHAFDGFERLVG